MVFEAPCPLSSSAGALYYPQTSHVHRARTYRGCEKPVSFHFPSLWSWAFLKAQPSSLSGTAFGARTQSTSQCKGRTLHSGTRLQLWSHDQIFWPCIHPSWRPQCPWPQRKVPSIGACRSVHLPVFYDASVVVTSITRFIRVEVSWRANQWTHSQCETHIGRPLPTYISPYFRNIMDKSYQYDLASHLFTYLFL